jgi:predicted patatin/cPLA2 family phospholipase
LLELGGSFILIETKGKKQKSQYRLHHWSTLSILENLKTWFFLTEESATLFLSRNHSRTGEEKEGRAFIVRPSLPLEVGRMERSPRKLEKLYQQDFY